MERERERQTERQLLSRERKWRCVIDGSVDSKKKVWTLSKERAEEEISQLFLKKVDGVSFGDFGKQFLIFFGTIRFEKLGFA